MSPERKSDASVSTSGGTDDDDDDTDATRPTAGDWPLDEVRAVMSPRSTLV